MNRGDSEPFHLQPVLSDLCTSRDLLDFTLSSPVTRTAPVQPTANAASSLFSSVSQFAAGVSQRAAGSTSPSPFAPPADSSPPPSSSTSPPPGSSTTTPGEVQVRCVEGYSNNLYVGGTDGHVEWWVYEGANNAGSSETGGTSTQGWRLRNRLKVSARSISKIVLLPKVRKCLVLTEGTLHPFTLPTLDPILNPQLSPIRGVVSVALNDDELDLGSGDTENLMDMTVVVLKRKGLLLCRLGTGLRIIKEMPLTGATRYQAYFSTYLCAALQTDSGLTYCIIDLSDASLTELLPVSQVPPDMGGYKPNPNVVVIPGENQFLVTIYTGASTMGVFLNNQGDPERGTIEWDDHPLSVAVESGYIIALLRNNTITIHSLDNLDRPAQVIALDSQVEAFGLSYSPYGIAIRDVIRDERMIKVPFTLLSGKLESSSPLPSWGIPAIASGAPLQSPPDLEGPEGSSTDEADAADPPSGSGLTPPASPKAKSAPVAIPTAPKNVPFSSAVAETLLVGRHTLQGLTPTPAIIRLERLCAEHKLDEAADLVDEERRRGRRGEIEGDKATHNATLRLLHLYLALHMLLDTVFERAGDYLVRGKIDPRLVVRLFPKFRGKVIGTAEQVEVFEGIRPVLADTSPIDDIISDFINRHAADHQQAEKDELHSALNDSAKNMLTEFLSKTRTARRNKGGARGIDSQKIDIVIDTTLAKLLADADLTNELMTLLSGTNDVVLPELEPFLARKRSLLLTVLRQQGQTERVLELLKEIAQDPTPDPLCPDPVGELVRELDSVQDPVVLRSYALWLVKRNFQQGLSILLAKGDKIKIDDLKLVDDLVHAGDSEAAEQYLEYAVIGKKSSSNELHERLLNKLFDEAEHMVKDDGIKYHLEELDAEYRLSSELQAYGVFFAEVAPPTPFKTMRLKLMLLLQASAHYDLDRALKRLTDIDLLVMERAIVLGRQHKNRAALALLVRDLPDSVSAQTYCTQDGEILPPKVARMVVQHAPELASWMSLFENRKRRGTVDSETQHKLVRELLGAYMRDGGNTARTAELLSAQGVHLDVMEVLESAPKEWPLEVITTFYRRSMRRQLHERAKWRILKSISAGQNLETAERYLDAMSHIPPEVETGPSGDEPLEEKVGEKGEIMSEKHLSSSPLSSSPAQLSLSLPTKEANLQEMRPMTNTNI